MDAITSVLRGEGGRGHQTVASGDTSPWTSIVAWALETVICALNGSKVIAAK